MQYHPRLRSLSAVPVRENDQPGPHLGPLVLWRQPHPCSLSSLPPFPLDLERSRSSLRKPQCSPHTPFVVRPFAPLPIIQALLLLDGRAYKLLVFWSQTFFGMMASKQGRVAGPLPISAMGSKAPGALPSLSCGILNVDGRQI